MKKDKEILKRIAFTLIVLFVYRLGTLITVPGVNVGGLSAALDGNYLYSLLNLLGGGGLEQFSLLALGVSPYITASIIIQLLSMDVIPVLSNLTKEGRSGRKKIDKYTRYLTVVLALIQGYAFSYGMAYSYEGLLFTGITTAKLLYVSLMFTAGTMFLIFLGDQISMKGIGNGISMIIATGIISRFPQQFATAWSSIVGEQYSMANIGAFALYLMVFLLIIVLIVVLSTAERRISIIRPSSALDSISTKNENYLPLKLNSASVIPVIFASSLMMTPLQVASFMGKTEWVKSAQDWLGMSTWYSLIIYTSLIIFFTFFYSNLQVDSEKLTESLAKPGAYIPNVRPGEQTKKYISSTLNKLTVFGAIALSFVANLPHVFPLVFTELPATMALGGTGMIIVVGVAMETIKQINGLKIQKSYQKYYG